MNGRLRPEAGAPFKSSHVKCDRCGRAVSDTVGRCPSCGNIIIESEDDPTEILKNKTNESFFSSFFSTKDTKVSPTTVVVSLIILFVIIIVWYDYNWSGHEKGIHGSPSGYHIPSRNKSSAYDKSDGVGRYLYLSCIENERKYQAITKRDPRSTCSHLLKQ